MAFKFIYNGELDKNTMAACYADTLEELMAENPNVVDVEADLGKALLKGSYGKIKEKFPNQLIDCGIMESNMVSVACGLSAMGRIAFCHTFASFAARRVADQAFISGCYSKANVRIIGSDPGVAAMFNGGTHMPFEDISIYRAYPEMTIIEPADGVAAAALTRLTAEKSGMYYIRLFRKQAPTIYAEGSTFEIGKANKLIEGKDLTIISSGSVVLPEAIEACKILEKEGIKASLLDMFTIKPLDEAAVIDAAINTGAIVTVENHNIINGLGSAVADVLATKQYCPLEKVGIQDRFGQVGPFDFLKKEYHLTAVDIAEAAKRALARK